ncbi:MAG: hypothetical protein IPM61_03760 [Chlorobi bacterium]|nr:MAG: hypothetical protein UZ07_CHB004003041 [Chlorobi bacterium OLB7]MBK8910423.1 hypothetical protein [Chlorobiota bacterium]MBX7217004.1 hypothetical protein [Candidatus Kapabacteria bacterium]
MQPQDNDLTRLAQQLLHHAEERTKLRRYVMDAVLQAAQRINQIEEEANNNLAQLNQSEPAVTQLQQSLMELHREFLETLRAVAPEMDEQELRLQLMRSIGLSDQQIALLTGKVGSG